MATHHAIWQVKFCILLHMLIHVIATWKLVWFVSDNVQDIVEPLCRIIKDIYESLWAHHTPILWNEWGSTTKSQDRVGPGQDRNVVLLINSLHLLQSRSYKTNRCFIVKSSHQFNKGMASNTPAQRPVPLPRPNGSVTCTKFYQCHFFGKWLNVHRSLLQATKIPGNIRCMSISFWMNREMLRSATRLTQCFVGISFEVGLHFSTCRSLRIARMTLQPILSKIAQNIEQLAQSTSGLKYSR